MQAFDDIARDLLKSLAASLQLPADSLQPVLDSVAMQAERIQSGGNTLHAA